MPKSVKVLKKYKGKDMLIERGDRPAEVEQINGFDKVDVTKDGTPLAVFSAERKYAMGAKPFQTAMDPEQLSKSIDRVSAHLERLQEKMEVTDDPDIHLSSNFNSTQYVLGQLQEAQMQILAIPEGLIDRVREQAQEQLLEEQRERGFFERVGAAITNE